MDVLGSAFFVEARLTPGRQQLRLQIDTADDGPGISIMRRDHDDLRDVKAIEISGLLLDIPDRVFVKAIRADTIPTTAYATRKNFADGIIGAQFLKHFTVCLDPEASRIAFGSPLVDWREENEGVSLRFASTPVGPYGAPFIVVDVDTTNRANAELSGIKLVLDTGSAVGVIEPVRAREVLRDHPSWGLGAMSSPAGDGDMWGSNVPVEMVFRAWFRSPDVIPFDWKAPIFLSVSQSKLEQSWSGIASPQTIDGRLGNDALLRNRTVIDYRKSSLFLSSNQRAQQLSESTFRVGVSLSFGSDGCPVVESVSDFTSSGSHYPNDLSKGDRLVLIDNVDACRMAPFEVSAALAGAYPTRTNIAARIQRGATTFDTILRASQWL